MSSSHVTRGALERGALERLADDGVLTALVDACGAPGVPARVLARVPDGGACLYQGADALAFQDRAPYLVRVDRAVLVWLLAPAADGGLGDTPWGWFAIADAPFAAQVRHWRGWLTVAPPAAPAGDPGADAPMAFRFYDPRLVEVFLGACTGGEVAEFFGPCRSLVVPAWEADGLAAVPGGVVGAGWRLTPGAAARGAARARRGVGERFQMRDAHLAAFRRRNFGDALIASVGREADALGQRAWRDPADPAAGDVLIAAVGGDARPGVPPMRLGFDARGFVGSVTSPLGRRWTTESGGDGQPRRLTLPSGGRLTYAYGADGRVARVLRGAPGAERSLYAFEHDATGRVTRTTYADGTAATKAYLHEGDEGVLDPGGARPAAVVDRLGRATRYAYDADGDLTAITDALGRTTRFRYARWRRPVAMTRPDGAVERYAYDDVGRLAAITGADGRVLRVRSDDAGRLLGLAGDGGAGVEGVDVALARDDAGRITEARSEARGRAIGAATLAVPTAAQFAYDAAGRVVRETATVGPVGLATGAATATEASPHAGASGLVAGAAPLRTVVAYAYDAQGALVGVTAPTGESLAYARDADGRLAAVTDWDGRRYALTYAAADGGWTLRTPDGVAVTCVQDAVGHPVRVVTHAPDGGLVADVATRYDAEDRPAAVEDARLGAWAYAYDAEGQVVACDGPSAAESARYAYDAAGNRVRVAPAAGPNADDLAAWACEVDGGDRLTRQGGVRLAYDAAGRAVERADDHGTGPEGAWRYAYDARGQLVRAWGRGADGAARALAFAYDALGRRVWKLAVERPGRAPGERVVARRTRFVWAGEQVMREVTEQAAWHARDDAGGWTIDAALARGAAIADALLGGLAGEGAAWREAEARDYAYWPGTATPLLLRLTRPDRDAPNAVSATTTYLYECDHLGAPVRLADAAGRVVWEAAYAPFGAARLTAEAVAQPLRRPGQYADAETGLCYNRLRYYDPGLGRYLTPDPAGLLGGLHAYRYAHNGPTWDADPLGLWPSWGTIAAIAVSVVVAVAVVALAPAALGVGAILLAGVAAGAVFGFLNEGLNHGFGCPSCLLKATLKGAVVGGLAALPFVALPAAAGVGAFMAAGGASGAISYTADWAMNGADPKQWSWGGFLASTAFGAATAGLGKYFEPEIGAAMKGARDWWQGEGATGAAPRDLANPLNYRVRVDPNKLGSNLGNVDVNYVGPRGGATSAEPVPAPAEPVSQPVGAGGADGDGGIGGTGGGDTGGGAPPRGGGDSRPRQFEPEPLAPGDAIGSDNLTAAQRARFRGDIDNPPAGKTADDVRYERHLQKRANLGDEPLSRDEWQASNDQLRANNARGTEQQDAAREGLAARLGRDLTDNNAGQVVQQTVTDPKTGDPVNTRPDSIGRNENGEIDLVHDHKDLSGADKVQDNDAQMRAQRTLLEDPDGRHVVTMSSNEPNLSPESGMAPEPRPTGPLARGSDVYFTDESGTVTHHWIADSDLPGGGEWDPVD